MAWQDVLEALALGAGRGFEQYTQAKTAQQEREERERLRAEEVAYRNRAFEAQQEAARRQEQLQLAQMGAVEATPEDLGGAAIEVGMPNLMELRERFAPATVAPPEVGDGGRMPGGAMVAPPQTYAAMNAPRDAEMREVAGEGVAGTLRGPTARQRGMDVFEFGGRRYMRPSEQLVADRQLRAAEVAAKAQYERDRQLAAEADARRAANALAEIRARAEAEAQTARQRIEIEAQSLIRNGVSPAEAYITAVTGSRTPQGRTIDEGPDFEDAFKAAVRLGVPTDEVNPVTNEPIYRPYTIDELPKLYAQYAAAEAAARELSRGGGQKSGGGAGGDFRFYEVPPAMLGGEGSVNEQALIDAELEEFLRQTFEEEQRRQAQNRRSNIPSWQARGYQDFNNPGRVNLPGSGR